MRKLLFALLAIALLIVVGLVVYKGFRIGKIEVWGIKQIVAENEQIDKANSDLEKLANDNFQAAITKLNSSGEAMQAKKKEYEEQAVLVSNSKYYIQTEKYKIDFLWTRIGNYAKENKVTPKMEVASESTKGIYNLIITAVGKYPNVADFIYAIENDSRLGFKIEDFSMTQYGSKTENDDGENVTKNDSNLVQGRFVCKEIRIDIKSIDGESSNSNAKTAEGESQSDTTNTTNTTNTTTNTTNSNTVDSNTTNTITSNSVNNENTLETINNNTTSVENSVNTANT